MQIKELILELRETVKQRNELENELTKIKGEIDNIIQKMTTSFILYEDINKVEEVIKDYKELKREEIWLTEVITALDIKIKKLNEKLFKVD